MCDPHVINEWPKLACVGALPHVCNTRIPTKEYSIENTRMACGGATASIYRGYRDAGGNLANQFVQEVAPTTAQQPGGNHNHKAILQQCIWRLSICQPRKRIRAR